MNSSLRSFNDTNERQNGERSSFVTPRVHATHPTDFPSSRGLANSASVNSFFHPDTFFDEATADTAAGGAATAMAGVPITGHKSTGDDDVSLLLFPTPVVGHKSTGDDDVSLLLFPLVSLIAGLLFVLTEGEVCCTSDTDISCAIAVGAVDVLFPPATACVGVGHLFDDATFVLWKIVKRMIMSWLD